MASALVPSDAELDAAFLAAARPFWHPVARSIDVAAAPLKVTLLAEPVVLRRGACGVVAFLDRCPHRGVPLSDGRVDDAGLLRCRYHEWGFDDSGACVDIPQQPGQHIPSVIRVRPVHVEEAAGLVWVCLADDPVRDRPQLPEVEREGWPAYVGEPMDWAGQACRQVENFCDIGHFSVLHTDTFGNPDEPAVAPYPVTREGWQVRCSYVYNGVNPVAPAGSDGRRPGTTIDFEYRIELPFSVHLGGAHGPRTVLWSAASPVSATQLRLFWISAFDPETWGADVDGPGLQAVEDLIWAPDRAIVASQRPVRLFAAAAEVHRAFDGLSVAYRQALRTLGFDPAAPELRASAVSAA